MFDHAFFADAVAGQIEGTSLAFSQSAHHLKSFDGCVGRFHRLEPAHWFDQLFQLAVISLNDVVEIFDLAVFDILWALAFLFQLAGHPGMDWIYNSKRPHTALEIRTPDQGFIAGEKEKKRYGQLTNTS